MLTDEVFLQECLLELKDGVTVTLRVPRPQRRHVREWMLKHGATDDDLMRLKVENGDVVGFAD